MYRICTGGGLLMVTMAVDVVVADGCCSGGCGRDGVKVDGVGV